MKKLAISFAVPLITSLAWSAQAAPPASTAQQVAAPAAAADGGTVSGWELLQEQPHTGQWKIFLCKDGMAAVNTKMGCTLVTKAPQWNVVMYNEKTKVYFLSPLAEWKGAQSSLKNSPKKQVYNRATTSLLEKPPKKLKDEVILGYKTTLYLTDNLVTTGLKKVEFSMSPDIEAPAQLQQVFGKIYGVGLTKLKGLPLRVSYIDENGKRSPVFNTLKISKQQIPMQNFTYPADYKRVDSEITVLMDEKGREAMASIMDDLGDGDGEDINALLDEKPRSSRRKSSLDNDDDNSSAATSSTEDAEKGDNLNVLLIGCLGASACAVVGVAAFLLIKKKPV